ncbi:MAG: HSP90 family protein [Bacteroidia bacterium]|nr:HSP90 family protein [Bacteroidia bacterium]
MEQGQNRFKVNFGGILTLLSQHLYSSSDVFVRELLQNAHDAIQFRRLSDPEFDGRGTISFDYIEGEQPLLIVEDNGCGMNVEEVEEFLSRIGSSSKRGIEALSGEGLIGQFGIGLLSCFMVSDKITLITRSFKEEKAVRWEAYIDGTYTSQEATEEFNTGTKLFLPLRNDLLQNYSKEKVIKLIRKYGTFLPIDISFQSGENVEHLEQKEFPWEIDQHKVLAFGREWFGENFKHYIKLESQSGLTQGIAFIAPRAVPQGSKIPHQVFIKNMLISDSSENILPGWFFFGRALINSQELIPTASREDIHENPTLSKVKEDFETCIEDHFEWMVRSEPEVLAEIIATHGLAIKAFALENLRFFKLVIGQLRIPTSMGEMSVDEILEHGNEIRYVDDLDKFRQLKPMFQASGQLVVNSGFIYDTSLLKTLALVFPEISLKLADDLSFSDVFQSLDWQEENDFQPLKNAMQEVLSKFRCEVILKRFDPVSIPGIYHITKQQFMTRDLERTRDLNQDSVWGNVLDDFIQEQKYIFASQLFVNIQNPLIERMGQSVGSTDLKDFIELIYVNALLLGHYTPNEGERRILNNNLINLIDKQLPNDS